MAGIGAYFMRFMRVGADFLKVVTGLSGAVYMASSCLVSV